MEEGLLWKAEEEEGRVNRRRIWDETGEELKKLGYLAGPMVIVGLTQYLLQMISTMMVGHLGELALSSASIATSLAGVAGFSLLQGLASALETLCGQAYGAKQYRKLGMHTNSAIISLNLVCLPLSLILFYMGKLLTLLGQDPLISLEAGKYARWLIPSLFAYATLQAQTRYLLSQSLILPMLFTSIAVPFVHIPLCWVLVFKSGLGNVGAAVALSLSTWFNVIVLAFYIMYSSSCEKTRFPLSNEAFQGIIPFLRLAIPSTLMVCLEWWSYELLVLLSGILPNPQLETSVLSICLTTIAFLFTIPSGLGAAASTRVSNELGAGNSKGARFVVRLVMSVAVMEASITSVCFFVGRYMLGYAFSNEKEVIDYVAAMTPLICISIIMDSLQGNLSGIARGCGWQHLGAYVNLGAFYLVGIPVAYILGFHLHFGGKGLWIGILSGSIVQTALLIIITSCTDWQHQVLKARDRVFDGRISVENDVMSTMMVGHLGELALSSTALATSLTGVAGYSLLSGMASALETLCGQAYGAKQYRKLGIHTYSAIISLYLVVLPLSLILFYIRKLLTFIGQDPLISLEAGKYARWLIPALFAYETLQVQTRYLLSQSLILPMLFTSVAVPFFHIPLCWVLVFKSGLGNIGAAVAVSLLTWFNVIILVFYIKYSSSCERTRSPLSKEAFQGIIPFFRLAIPSTLMVCLEWWSYELLILLSGLLPNPQFETSVLSICLTTIVFLCAIPTGIGAAASTRVSNELGAGSSKGARFVVHVVMSVAVVEGSIRSISFFAGRYMLGNAFSNEKEVIDYVAAMTPLICMSIIMDSLQGVLSGISRGCGWQHLGAYVNLGAFYLVGIPVAYLLGFHLHFGGKGLWIGLLSGCVVQTTLLIIITSCTDWQHQVLKARDRVFERRICVENDVCS